MLTDGRLGMPRQGLTTLFRRSDHGCPAVGTLRAVPRDTRRDTIGMREIEEHPRTIIINF